MRKLIDRPGRPCRFCGKRGVPPFQREHVACRTLAPHGFCSKCAGMLRKEQPSGMCTNCARDSVKDNYHPCSGPGCLSRCLKTKERCWQCECNHKRQNQPMKLCRTCGLVPVERKQGRSVCDGCTTRKQTRIARVAMRENPTELGRIIDSGDVLSREQVGAMLGCSHERVRQLEMQALKNFARNWQRMFGTPLRDEVSHSLPTIEPILDECG